MKLNRNLAFGLAACLIAATPALAQPTPDSTKPGTQADATKQRTQGVPAGGNFTAPEYGAAQKQHTAGVPAGGNFQPPQYGSAQGGIQK